MLSGNGYGFGAYKIVRGMYERVVTAMYIAKDPGEARKFALAIDKFKLWERTVAAAQRTRRDGEEVDDGLYRLYGQFYLDGTAQSHANSLGMERRLKRTEHGGWTYQDTPRRRASLP